MDANNKEGKNSETGKILMIMALIIVAVTASIYYVNDNKFNHREIIKKTMLKNYYFFDEGSLNIRDIVLDDQHPNLDISYCFMYNAKNRLGGYAGWEIAHLNYWTSTEMSHVTLMGDETFNDQFKDIIVDQAWFDEACKDMRVLREG